jgi:hypothetical protein
VLTSNCENWKAERDITVFHVAFFWTTANIDWLLNLCTRPNSKHVFRIEGRSSWFCPCPKCMFWAGKHANCRLRCLVVYVMYVPMLLYWYTYFHEHITWHPFTSAYSFACASSLVYISIHKEYCKQNIQRTIAGIFSEDVDCVSSLKYIILLLMCTVVRSLSFLLTTVKYKLYNPFPLPF